MACRTLGWVTRRAIAHRLDSMILEIFSNINDSGILGFCVWTLWQPAASAFPETWSQALYHHLLLNQPQQYPGGASELESSRLGGAPCHWHQFKPPGELN